MNKSKGHTIVGFNNLNGSFECNLNNQTINHLFVEMGKVVLQNMGRSFCLDCNKPNPLRDNKALTSGSTNQSMRSKIICQ